MSDTTRTISDNIQMVTELWPHFEFTPAVRGLWTQSLKDLRQDVLEEAIRLTRRAYSSREPEIKWVDERYRTLYSERHPTIPQTRENATQTWHVSWQRTSRHGVPNAWYGCRTDTREEAERIAKANRGRVTNMDANDDQVTEHELHREHMDALTLIESMPREQIEAHLTRLRSVGFCKGQLPSRVREWPRMAVLAVHAAHQLASKESKS